MAVKQLSVYADNRPGTLVDIVSRISGAGVNMRAICVAETQDFGIVRLILSDIETAKKALGDAKLVAVTDVVVAKMADKAGALSEILGYISREGINVEYMYAFTGTESFGGACVVLRVNDAEAAEEVLRKNGVATLRDEDMQTL